MTKVSFVVTVFNKEEYLPLVIRSLDVQVGDFEKEYVFVDDGSTDRSVEVIKECTKDADFDVKIVSQINQGASVAHDAGVSAATGDWIKFCDGDDLFTGCDAKLVGGMSPAQDGTCLGGSGVF